jgi:hypothetical protein
MTAPQYTRVNYFGKLDLLNRYITMGHTISELPVFDVQHVTVLYATEFGF